MLVAICAVLRAICDLPTMVLPILAHLVVNVDGWRHSGIHGGLQLAGASLHKCIRAHDMQMGLGFGSRCQCCTCKVSIEKANVVV